MPDFDKELNPITKETPEQGILPINPIVPMPSVGGEAFNNASGRLAAYKGDLATYLSQTSNFNNAPPEKISDKTLSENQRFATVNPSTPDEENAKAEGQGAWSRLANAGANAIAKTIGYTAQNAGFILGAPAAAITGNISNMTDNFLVKAGDWLNQEASQNFPVYKTDKYTQGNIWDKLLTSSWWLDDATDRLALTASMFIPGAAEAKGIGLAGVAERGLAVVAENPENYGWIGKTFLPRLYKAAATGLADVGTNPALKAYAQSLTKAELYSWNTIGQAALNAKETQDAIFKATGDKQKAAEGARNAFWETVPVTLASGLFELPQMFATTRNAESLLNKFFNPETGEAIEGALKPTSIPKTAGKALATGFEHGQSESLQVAISRYNEDKAKGKDVRGTIDGIWGDFLDNINDPNGQNNIALGTIQGILTTIGGRAYARVTGQASEEQAYKNTVFNQIQEAKLQRRLYNTDFAQRDENGKISVSTDGKPIYNQDKLAEAGLSLAGLTENIEKKTNALANGDYMTVAKIDHDELAAFSQNFFDDPNGMEHLTSLLKIEANEAKKNPDRLNDLDEHGNEITPDIQLQRNLEKVEQFRKAYNAIEQRHAGFFDLQLENKNDRKEQARATQFISGLKNAQYFNTSDQLFIKDRITRNTSELGSLGVQIPEEGKAIANPSNPSEERSNELIKENLLLNKEYDRARINYQNLINKEAQRQAFKEDKESKDAIGEKVEDQENQAKGNPAPKPSAPTFTNSDKQDEEVRVGGQYVKPVDKKFSVRQDGEKFSVVKPDTTVHSVYDTKKEAEDKRDQFNAALQVTSKLTVTGIAPNGQLEVADTEGNIHYLNPSRLAGYSKILTDEDKFLRNTKKQSIFFKSQQKVNKEAGISIITPDEQKAAIKEDDEKRQKNDPYPTTDRMYVKTIGTTDSKKPSDVRHKTFLSKADLLPNRDNIYSELITKNSEESAGIQGVIKLAATNDKGEEYIPTDEDHELIIRIYRTKEGYIDENGKSTDDINKMVFETMPSTSLVYENGDPSGQGRWTKGQARYSGNEEVAKQYQEAWKAKRTEILGMDKPYTEDTFDISRGVAQRLETGANSVIDVLVDRDALNYKKQVLEVVTTEGGIAHQGKSLNFPRGSVVLKNGSIVELVNNRQLTEQEANNVYEALVKYVDNANSAKNPDEANRELKEYLHGIVYFRSPFTEENEEVVKKHVGRNQFFFHKGNWYFGNAEFPILFTKQATEANKETILSFLRSIYINPNVYNIRDNEAYKEITGWEEGKPITREWATYQHYLLDDKYPDGTNRAIKDIPLTTDVAKPIEKGDVSFKNRYSYNSTLLTIQKEENPTAGLQPRAQAGSKFGSVGSKFATIAPKQEEIKSEAPTKQETREEAIRKAIIPIPEGEKYNITVKKGYKEIYIQGANGIYRVAGIPLESYKGFEFAITGKSGDYSVTELSSGMSIGVRYNTQKEAKEGYKSYLDNKNTNWTNVVGNSRTQLKLINNRFKSQTGVESTEEPKTEEKKSKFGGVGAKLAGQVKKEDFPPEPNPSQPKDIRKDLGDFNIPDAGFRLVTTLDYAKADVNKEAAYILEKSPFSVSIANSLIDAGNGMFAHGAYQDAAIKLSEKMEEGTGYHEYFHGIMDVFTNNNEKAKIYNEFGSREGSYTDRFGKSTKYSEATIADANEQLAEEFRNRVLFEQEPPKAKKGNFIIDLFNKIWSYIKSIFTGDIKSINDLFERANSGYYKNVPFKSVPSGELNLRARTLGTMDVKDSYTTIKAVASSIFSKIFEDKENGLRIINELDFGGIIPSKYYDAVYNDLETLYTKTLPNTAVDMGYTRESAENSLYPTWKSIAENWEPQEGKGSVKELVGELFKTMNIVQKLETEGIENEQSEYAGRTDSYNVDTVAYDAKKNAPASIKMMYSFNAESLFVKPNGTPVINEATGFNQISNKRDQSTQLAEMTEAGRLFNFSLSKLNAFNTLKEKEEEIARLADQFPNYVRIAQRLYIQDGYDDIPMDKWILKIKHYSTMSKQKPEAFIQFVQKDDTITIGTATPIDSIEESQQNWLQLLKENKSLISENNGVYTLDSSKLPKSTKTVHEQYEFLKQFGIQFSSEQQNIIVQNKMQDKIASAINGIKEGFRGRKILATSVKNLQIAGSLKTLFEIYFETKAYDPDGSYIGIGGKRNQAYPQTNAFSRINNDINNSNTKDELLRRLPHLNNDFSQDSIYIGEMFDKDGNRIKTTDRKNPFELKSGYIQGTIDNKDKSQTETPKLSKADRLNQAINSNLGIIRNQKHYGLYYIITPMDGKMEWVQMLKNLISVADTRNRITDGIVDKFWNYYQTEQELYNTDKKDRLFSTMGIEYSLSKEDFSKAFRNAVEREVEFQFDELREFNILKARGNNYRWVGLNKSFTKDNLNHKNLSESAAKDILRYRTANFMLNNIEMFKLYFGDPASYPDFKRFKAWLSPAEQSVYDTKELDYALNKKYNNVANTELKQGDPGYQDHKDYMKTVTIADVLSENKELGYIWDKDNDKSVNGADSQAWAHLASYRQMFIKNGGRWSSKHDTQAAFNMAQDRMEMEKDGLYIYPSEQLKKYDQSILERGNPHSATFNPLKPKVAGYSTENNPLIDKDSVAMQTYYGTKRYNPETGNMETTNMSLQYARMLKNGVDYVIMKSGRKVGAQTLDTFYKEDGTPNEDIYKEDSIVNVPFKWFGIQVETQANKTSQTLGTQFSKLSTVNLLSGGIPQDIAEKDNYDRWYGLTEDQRREESPTYKLVAHERDVREKMIDNGYNQLLDKLGIQDKEDHFEAPDKTKLQQILTNELYRRELADNIKDALEIDPNTNDFKIPLEAIPNYESIKGIMFSFVDKYIASPKVNGGAKIQQAGTGYEFKGNRTVARKDSKGNTYYSNAGLKFYTKEQPWCEVGLPCHFAKQLRATGIKMTDEELITYLNKSDEGKRILTGLGFRIPTQDLNSSEVLRVAFFLPEEYGDTIVVPEEITRKAGSDFDVDKLNTYLKNIYIDRKGEIKLIPFMGFGEEAKNKLKELTTLTKEQFIEELLSPEDTFVDMTPLDLLYKKSLENEWFETTEKLLQLPQNFERLITPNSTEDLHAISKKLVGISKREFEGTDAPESPLSPTYMNNIRHVNVVGLAARGIPVNNQNNTALAQKELLFLDPNRVHNLTDKNEQKYIGDASIKLPNNNITFRGKEYSTISKIRDRAGKYISDIVSQFINGFVDIAKDTFLMKMGVTPNNVATFLTLIKHGVPADVTSYFMNQPIIREYQKLLSRNGFTYPYIDDLIKEVRRKFDVEYKMKNDKNLPKEFPEDDPEKLSKWLKQNIQDYYGDKKRKFTTDENAMQRFILNEYLKYTVMSGNLFRVMYAGNWDTGNFPSPYLVSRRNQKTQQAQTDNIYSSANNLLNHTFEGAMKTAITNGVNAISESYFKFLGPEGSSYIQDITDDFAERKRLRDDDYVNASMKVEHSFINYLSQNILKYNTRIKQLLVDDQTSLAKDIQNIKKNSGQYANSAIANNKIVQQLQVLEAKTPNSSKAVKIANRAYDAFSQNTYTEAMRELKTHYPDFYSKLVKTAFLQSGIGMSSISFTDLIPFEDYEKFITPALKGLYDTDLLQGFKDTDTFYRNSWKDYNIVPRDSRTLANYKDDDAGIDPGKRVKNFYDVDNGHIGAEALYKLAASRGLNTERYLVEHGSDEEGTYMNNYEREWQAMAIHPSRKISGSKFISINREIPNLTPEQRIGLKKAGLPTNQTVLMKRVEYDNGKPLEVPYVMSHPENVFHIYIPVNAWGDGYKAQEHYDSIRQSEFDNNTYKPIAELNNNDIIDAISKGNPYIKGVTPENQKSIEENLTKLNFQKGKC